ncbi:adenylosuccinate synthase [Candidatus Woesearchaeota archaeon]|nr:adenylosuccinate synthase [Candidatus Woesearchaeota archaeon]
MENLNSILNGKQTVAIVCNQWGDTGKGKFVDLCAEWADIVARGTGGNNAGHTIILNGKEYIFHLVPSGILRDGEGKINIMGSGMVDDLGVLVGELDELDEQGYGYNGLRISERANVILPYHKELDGKHSSMQKGKIGTTGRGIGQACADKVARFGIMVGDLKDKDNFVRQLKRVQGHHFYLDIDIDKIVEQEMKHYQRIKEFVCDTDALLRSEMKKGKKVLLEGAQGLLLSIDYGTLPYVTSSDPSRIGLAKGVGLLPEDVDLTLGIVKFPFMTRVGNGPFPTEYGGKQSEEYCAEGEGNANKRETEEGKYGRMPSETLINFPDPLTKGIGIRLAAGEYGATTGRPRRTGRTDLVALKHAMSINGPDIILTKADCVAGMDEIELGTGYVDEQGKEVREVSHGSDIAYGLKGLYVRLSGWGDISGCRNYGDLPRSTSNAVEFLEGWTGARVRMVSVGAGREQTIVKQ